MSAPSWFVNMRTIETVVVFDFSPFFKGDLEGFWGITISANWRLIFRFEKGDAFDVDLIDYH